MSPQRATMPRRPVYVAGVGMTPFAKTHDAPSREQAAGAIREALADGA